MSICGPFVKCGLAISVLGILLAAQGCVIAVPGGSGGGAAEKSEEGTSSTQTGDTDTDAGAGAGPAKDEDKFAAQGNVLVSGAANIKASAIVTKGDVHLVLRQQLGSSTHEIIAAKSGGKTFPLVTATATGTGANPITHLSTPSVSFGDVDSSPVVYSTKNAAFAIAPVEGGEPKMIGAAMECVAITNDNTFAYCLTAASAGAPHTIVRLTLDGSREPTVISSLDPSAKVTAFILDATTNRLFLACSASNTIRYVSATEGGAAKILIEKVSSVSSMTSDTDNLYVASAHPTNGTTTILQINKLEAFAMPLFAAAGEITSLVLRDEHVYFVSPGTKTDTTFSGYLKYSGSISKIAINTSSVANERQYIVTGLHQPVALNVASTHVYVASAADGSLTELDAINVNLNAAASKCQAKWRCDPCNNSCMLGHATSCMNLGCAFVITVDSITDTKCNVTCVNPGNGGGEATGSTTL